MLYLIIDCNRIRLAAWQQNRYIHILHAYIHIHNIVYILIYIHIHLYISIYIYIHTYVYFLLAWHALGSEFMHICNQRNRFPFFFKLNGIWSWWQFSFRFWTKKKSICNKMKRNTSTTIISHWIWKKMEFYLSELA